MKSSTTDWLEKAHKNFLSARAELRRRKYPNYDLVCFLSQQSAELTIKALLNEIGVSFKKTHDLTVLSAQLAEQIPTWTWDAHELSTLTYGAVTFRYPGETATKLEAQESLKIASSLMNALRPHF